MPELRWTLLLLGILFLAGLVWWEVRKGRLARRDEGGARSAPAPSTEPLLEMRAAPREAPFVLPEIRAREPARELPVIEIEDFAPMPAPPAGPDGGDATIAAGTLPAAEVQVDWPPEAERRLIGVRLVAVPGARYSGRLLRQALAGSGLVHGRFGIFHFPAPDRRAIFSVASLTKPGNFDLESMDAQRYAGLSLFAVLPGPLEPAEAIEQLLVTARDLAGRLGGSLQDDRGQPLEADRLGEPDARAPAGHDRAVEGGGP